jgi:hypothetical protein
VQVSAHFRNWTRVLLLLGLVTSFPGTQWAAARLDPRETVNRFCELDLGGVRLDSTNPHRSELSTLVVRKGDWPEEPVRIVTAFRVVSVQSHGGTALVGVEYQSLGSLGGALESDRLVREDTPETVKFPLLLVHGSWKIKPFELPPHVSAEVLRDHVRNIMDSDEKAGDTHRREILQRLLVRLGSLDG